MKRRIPVNGARQHDGDRGSGGAPGHEPPVGFEEAVRPATDEGALPEPDTADTEHGEAASAEAGIVDDGMVDTGTADAAERPAGTRTGARGPMTAGSDVGIDDEPALDEARALDEGESTSTETVDADAAAALAAVMDERDQYLEALQRLKAEFENYRRRSQREVAEAGSQARIALLREFLPVSDNLDRALSAAEHHEESKVLEGVRLTHDLFADLLRKEGVAEVEALGRTFDPTVHEALMVHESSEHEEGIVTAVLERGYVCGDRVLRPAKVAVSTSPVA